MWLSFSSNFVIKNRDFFIKYKSSQVCKNIGVGSVQCLTTNYTPFRVIPVASQLEALTPDIEMAIYIKFNDQNSSLGLKI